MPDLRYIEHKESPQSRLRLSLVILFLFFSSSSLVMKGRGYSGCIFRLRAAPYSVAHAILTLPLSSTYTPISSVAYFIFLWRTAGFDHLLLVAYIPYWPWCSVCFSSRLYLIRSRGSSIGGLVPTRRTQNGLTSHCLACPISNTVMLVLCSANKLLL